MTFAWYAHLKNMHSKPWIIAAMVSWGIALFEYLFQVPANRVGYTVLSLGQHENHAGGNYSAGICSFFLSLHERAAKA